MNNFFRLKVKGYGLLLCKCEPQTERGHQRSYPDADTDMTQPINVVRSGSDVTGLGCEGLLQCKREQQ